MKELVLLNADDGFIVIEVDARSCKYCNSAFTYKGDNCYFLVDRNTGLSIAKSKKLKDLEEKYHQRKEKYEQVQKTDAYKIKVERFNLLVLKSNYAKRG